MPKKGCYDNTYPDKLKEIGILLLETFNGAKKHHLMKCQQCEYEWSATPISKLQNFKKHNIKGCPKCTDKVKYETNRIQNLKELHANGFEILTENYNGKRYLDHGKSPHLKIKVKNTSCGHIFESSPSNLLARKVNCPVCNNVKKREAFQGFNKVRQAEYQETASEWNIFRYFVYTLTKLTYKDHHKTINPKNLLRGKAGVDGAYHLDHIVPVRYCFDNNIPAELCAHSSNLQMLHWHDNVGSRDKLKTSLPIPQIIQEYIATSS